MSWICKKCETENPDTMDVCEVCDAIAPRIIDFSYDKLLMGSPIKVKWKAEFCDSVTIEYDGKRIDVSGKEFFEIENPVERDISFFISNIDTTSRMVLYHMDFLDKPKISFNADKLKLKRDLGESVNLTWKVENALSIKMICSDTSSEIDTIGSKTISPVDDSVYTIEALALDGKTIFSENLVIKVFDECKIDYFTDKYYVFPSIPITLSWNVKNAKKVWFGSEEVNASGKKVVEQDHESVYTLFAEDEFGKKEKSITVGMLPVPQVKSLLVPVPNIVNNMSITINQPRYNVNVRFPQVDIDWIKAEVPRVKSFKDLGLNVELSPPSPKLSFMSSIKRVFNNVTSKWIWKK
jgi:hypothetical protein